MSLCAGKSTVSPASLFLGVDGGGTTCRARLATASRAVLAEALAGPANVRLGLEEAFGNVLIAGSACLRAAGLPESAFKRIIACLALAGASEPAELAAARQHRHPFHQAVFTTDAHAACVGAHGGRDGAIIIVGTGSIGWAIKAGQHHRIGGWGPVLSDEGSGAWIGRELLRQILRAHDGRIPSTDFLNEVFHSKFGSDPHRLVSWSSKASPREFGSLAPEVIRFASSREPTAVDILERAAKHIDELALNLTASGHQPLAVLGGLATHVEPWLCVEVRRRLVAPEGDALDGALQLAFAEEPSGARNSQRKSADA